MTIRSDSACASAFERVGDNQTIKVDVRVIAASNRDLPALLRENRFRDDLFYRVRVFPIRIPLVRAEGEDAVGFLLVGPRPDDSVISKDEQKALNNVSEVIARAIRNVVKRVAYERRLESMIEANSRRLDELEARIAEPDIPAVPTSRAV